MAEADKGKPLASVMVRQSLWVLVLSGLACYATLQLVGFVLHKGTPVGVLQDNSLGWGSFMAVSSNTRYQLVNTIEERLMVRSFMSSCLLIV